MVEIVNIKSVKLHSREVYPDTALVDFTDDKDRALRLRISAAHELTLLHIFHASYALRQKMAPVDPVLTGGPTGLVITLPLVSGQEFWAPITRKGLEEFVRTAMDVLEHVD